MIETQNEYGRWVPAEPLESTFGLRWELAWRHRRKLEQGWLRSIVGGWRDTRAVDRLAAPSDGNEPPSASASAPQEPSA